MTEKSMVRRFDEIIDTYRCDPSEPGAILAILAIKNLKGKITDQFSNKLMFGEENGSSYLMAVEND